MKYENKSATIKNGFFLLGVALLIGMIYQLGFESIISMLLQTGWWFVAIIGIWIFVYGLNAVSFHTIIRNDTPESKKVSFWRTFQLTVSGYAINYVTPFGLLAGEPYRIIELRRYISSERATSSVLLYALMHFVTRFIFWIVSLPVLMFIVKSIPFPVKFSLTAVALISLILLFYSFRLYNKGFIMKTISLACKLPYVGKSLINYRENNSERLTQMDFYISDLYRNHKKDFLISFFAELLSRFVWCAEVMLMMYPVSKGVNYMQSVISESVASIMGNLMFFMPMQLGAREGGFVLAFSLFSMPAALGVYVSLCTRIRELFWTVIGFILVKTSSSKNMYH